MGEQCDGRGKRDHRKSAEALKPALGVSRLPGRNIIQGKPEECGSELAVRNEDGVPAKGKAEVETPS